MKLKVLSWNIWERCKFELLKDYLAESKADIIGLQKVLVDDPERDTVSFLKGLGYEYAIVPHVKWRDENRGNLEISMNNAVFSKYPIVDSKGHTLIEGRMGAVIEAKIKVGDEILSVFSVHLKHTHLKESEYQLEQARNLLKLVPKEKAIVMGDFNALPESNTVKLMSSALVNTDPSNKPTWSMYPDGCPVCEPDKLAWRFDYIFTTNDLKFNSAEVGESRASDHLPIFTILN